MKTLEERNQEIIDSLCSGHVTVLIDHTYNKVNIFADEVGLDHDRDLGEDWEDWYEEDLYNYTEVDAEELDNLKETYYFIK